MMVMLDVLGDCMLERCFAEEDHPAKTLVLGGFDESLGKSVEVRVSRRGGSSARCRRF